MYKAHWDSKKEYEKFWAGSSDFSMPPTGNRKESRKKRFGIMLSLLLILFAGLAAVYGLIPWYQMGLSRSIVDSTPDAIPDFSGKDYIFLNQNVPNFSADDCKLSAGEYYSELDYLGRCGTAFAVLHRSMMPTEEREGIGMIKPSGWNQNRYEGIVDSNPPYLYNRCHLIAYALSGENANEKNLITGTRYFNETSMLSFEKKVMEYLDSSENHVLYRVSPYFKDKELVARGVELEAYSVEDHGEGISFHVFVYNYQPKIEIDYRTGENRIMLPK